MIRANGIVTKPTIFPDGTSQIWHLPKKLLDGRSVHLIWDFEAEREIIDLYAIRRLMPGTAISLHMPYLPYARQDKPVSNDATFNLSVFATLINRLQLYRVTALDVHNAKRTAQLIHDFSNISPCKFQRDAIRKAKPDFLVFPDLGAWERYSYMHDQLPAVVFKKKRNSNTGNIAVTLAAADAEQIRGRGLIVDDICDGGATFIRVAQEIRHHSPKTKLFLAVTHGIFSKGKKVLTDCGIKIIERKK